MYIHIYIYIYFFFNFIFYRVMIPKVLFPFESIGQKIYFDGNVCTTPNISFENECPCQILLPPVLMGEEFSILIHKMIVRPISFISLRSI
jgi:hypothetical protein